MSSTVGTDQDSRKKKSSAGRKGGIIFQAFADTGEFVGEYQNRNCLYCNRLFKGVTRQRACDHILKECKTAPSEAKQGAKTSNANKVAPNVRLEPAQLFGSKRSRSSLDGFVDSTPVSNEFAKQINHALLLFLVLAGISFSSVQNSAFTVFCQLLRPN